MLSREQADASFHYAIDSIRVAASLTVISQAIAVLPKLVQALQSLVKVIHLLLSVLVITMINFVYYINKRAPSVPSDLTSFKSNNLCRLSRSDHSTKGQIQPQLENTIIDDTVQTSSELECFSIAE